MHIADVVIVTITVSVIRLIVEHVAHVQLSGGSKLFTKVTEIIERIIFWLAELTGG